MNSCEFPGLPLEPRRDPSPETPRARLVSGPNQFMTTGAQVTPSEMEQRVRGLCPIYDHIGLRVESLDEIVVCTVPLVEANTNHLGGVHAAVQWAVAEAIGGIAYLAHPELGPCWIAVRSVTIEFSEVANTDLRAEATFGPAQIAAIAAQLDDHGKADYELDIALRDTNDRIVTTAVGHYYLRRTET